jgi:TonB-dependent starch-binding outer membrane protein SusC
MMNHFLNYFRKYRNMPAKGVLIAFMLITATVLQTYAAQQDKKTIAGTVTDALTGESLPGATIMEKGTSNGTITGIDGQFTLRVAENSTLIVTYVSYKMQEFLVSGKSEFKIVLEPDVVGVEDVVVIGYGTVKKSDLTGAVASIAADDIRSNIGSGIDQALQGRTAGVTVTSNSGTPGASPTVRIRGMGTITNPNPFYVVDGIPVSAESVGMLNPGDIESMEVLKDASAAAIYGARAANGVILITTRRAKTGKSNIMVDAYTGVQNVAKKYDIMNGSDWITYRNAAKQAWQDSSQVNQTDWQDEIFRQALVNNVQVSFLNGTEKINSAIIGSYFKQEGIVKGSDYERFTLRINTTSNLKPWLTIGENIGISSSTQNIVPEQNEWSSVVIQALTMDPTTPVYNENNDHHGSLNNNITNPMGLIERNHNVLKTNQLLGSAFIEIKPLPWISFKSSVGAEISQSNNEQFTPIFYESTTVNSSNTSLYHGDFKMNTFLFEQLLTFTKNFNDVHNVQFLAGYTRQQSSYRLNMRQIAGVPSSKDLWLISNGEMASLQYEDVAGLLPVPLGLSGQPYDASMISYLARLIYSYKNRYDLTASVRRDGSSKFGPASRWGNFPSFALGWKLSEEAFFPKNNIVNFAKIRAGWGKLGNQEIGNYASYTNVTYGFNYTFGEYGAQASYPGGAPTGFANAGIKWEETVQTNLGLDMYMFDSKLNLNFDYFNRITEDMLAQVPVPNLTGILTPPFANAGSISNKGWELNASYRNRDKAFKWQVGMNLGHVKNNVERLGSEQPINSAPFRASDYISRTQVGMPIASFYGFITDGIYQTQDEIDQLNEMAREKTGNPKFSYDNRRAKPGDIKYKDISGPKGEPDGVIDSYDRDFIGNPHPKLTYGVNIEMEYKGFDLKVFGQGVYGNDIFMATLYYLQSGDGYWNLLNSSNNYWQKEGDITNVPGLGQVETNMRLSDRYIRDGSFFRIKNVQLGYTLPKTFTTQIGFESIRVYATGQNLLSFHKYEGFDPEIGTGRNQGGSVNQRGLLDIGIDRGMYPLAKAVSLGINVTF